mgnify:CR=1 FL=1|tara:strand:- start:277 stop:477 length:201 start_codon:yes stop_codon:yes gene_type:complete
MTPSKAINTIDEVLGLLSKLQNESELHLALDFDVDSFSRLLRRQRTLEVESLGNQVTIMKNIKNMF